MADLKTNLLGFVMNSPVIGASGTVGYGVEYEELADFAKIGGISGKGLTLHGQYGNKGERLWETPSGLINSIGILQQVMPVQRATPHTRCKIRSCKASGSLPEDEIPPSDRRYLSAASLQSVISAIASMAASNTATVVPGCIGGMSESVLFLTAGLPRA